MRRKAFGRLFIMLSPMFILAALAHDSSSTATIKKITAQRGELNTRVILETDSAPTLARTYYAAKAIVVELDQVSIAAQPPAEAADSQPVTGIRLEKTGTGQARLEIQVQEPIPYTVISSESQTVIELNRVQRGPGEIPQEPEVQRRLAQSSGTNAFMTKLNVEEKDGRLQFWAKLSSQTVARVFTLENPLRLVVDVYDSVYEGSRSTIAVDKYGLSKVRVAQFQFNNPRCITSEIAVSFFKE
jgi:hypothetical protein